MKSSCAAIVASTVCGSAFAHAASSSQMNTRYSAISAADNRADLDADPAPQARAPAGQAGGLVSVGRGDDDIPRDDRGGRIDAIRAAQGADRAHLVSYVRDRGAKAREPGTPLLPLIRVLRAAGLAAEGENVLGHNCSLHRAGAVRRPLLIRQSARRQIDNHPDEPAFVRQFRAAKA